MGKPEIIGYTTDNARVWSSPPMPEGVRIGSEGIWIPTIGIGFDGAPYETERKLDPEEVDGFMRHYGMKRVYKSREFRAAKGCGMFASLWLLHHKRCGYFWHTAMGPHDSAKHHLEGYCHAKT